MKKEMTGGTKITLIISGAAMLAGIIPAPSVWTPDVNPKQAEKRYKRVLNIMDEDGYITPDEKKAAKIPANHRNPTEQPDVRTERIPADDGAERTRQHQGVQQAGLGNRRLQNRHHH